VPQYTGGTSTVTSSGMSFPHYTSASLVNGFPQTSGVSYFMPHMNSSMSSTNGLNGQYGSSSDGGLTLICDGLPAQKRRMYQNGGMDSKSSHSSSVSQMLNGHKKMMDLNSGSNGQSRRYPYEHVQTSAKDLSFPKEETLLKSLTKKETEIEDDIEQKKLELFENTLYGYNTSSMEAQSQETQYSVDAFSYFVNNIQESNPQNNNAVNAGSVSVSNSTQNVGNGSTTNTSSSCDVCLQEKMTGQCLCGSVGKAGSQRSMLRHTLTCPEEEADQLYNQTSSQLASTRRNSSISQTSTDMYNGSQNQKEVSFNSNQLISDLIICDRKLRVNDLYNIPELIDKNREDISKILCDLGDRVVGKLVLWTKALPFFHEVPLEVHSDLLATRWQELLLLITTAHRAVFGFREKSMTVEEMYSYNMGKLQVKTV